MKRLAIRMSREACYSKPGPGSGKYQCGRAPWLPRASCSGCKREVRLCRPLSESQLPECPDRQEDSLGIATVKTECERDAATAAGWRYPHGMFREAAAAARWRATANQDRSRNLRRTLSALRGIGRRRDQSSGRGLARAAQVETEVSAALVH